MFDIFSRFFKIFNFLSKIIRKYKLSFLSLNLSSFLLCYLKFYFILLLFMTFIIILIYFNLLNLWSRNWNLILFQTFILYIFSCFYFNILNRFHHWHIITCLFSSCVLTLSNFRQFNQISNSTSNFYNNLSNTHIIYTFLLETLLFIFPCFYWPLYYYLTLLILIQYFIF
jgi:hypothetical protein